MGKRLCEVSNMCTSRRRCSNNRPNQSKSESLMMMIPYVKASDHQEGMMKCRNQIHVMQNGSKAVTFLCTDQAELKFYFKSKGKLGFCTVEKPGRRRGQHQQHPMSVCIDSDPCNKKQQASSIIHAKFEADGEAASHGMCPRNKISYELCAPEDRNLNINLNTQDQVCSPQHCTNVKVGGIYNVSLI